MKNQVRLTWDNDKTDNMGCLDSTSSSQRVTVLISPWVKSPKHDDERCLTPFHHKDT
jgi:hypothetical protein